MIVKSICKRHLAILAALLLFLVASTAGAASGPELGAQGKGPALDKSGDAGLQKLIHQALPQFEQLEFKGKNATLRYNLFAPKDPDPGKKYPLVLFMADASTPGQNVELPLTQGYGALVFAAPEAQAKHPCYVLAPQFSGVAVNDDYRRTLEVETVLELVKDISAKHAVDTDRLYVTGQSMGGMIAMYYNIAHPGIFAASLFVDCHWDSSKLDKLIEHPFIFIYAGEGGKSRQCCKALEEACRKMSKGYTWSEWSAKLPLSQQNELAATQLAKGQPVNLMGFENGSVLPENGKGSEHMYSFDYAYRLEPPRDWLFGHSLAKAKN